MDEEKSWRKSNFIWLHYMRVNISYGRKDGKRLMKLSVIIVSYENCEILRDCLDSIKKFNDLKDEAEIIISDNSITNSVYEMVKKDYPEIQIIKNNNIGFGPANNRAVDISSGEYSTAYERLVLLAKSGKIGKVVSVDAVCTSLRDGISIAGTDLTQKWNSMCGWAPAALLPVFQILGTEYRKKVITTKFLDEAANMDAFTKIDFTYDDAVASIKVAKAAKSEGELIVTGTKGYIYVPAPWWKTDYFEVRYENPEDNQRFFYQLDGEGIRYEIVAFAKSVEVKKPMNYVEKGVSKSIAKIIESFNDRTDMIVI